MVGGDKLAVIVSGDLVAPQHKTARRQGTQRHLLAHEQRVAIDSSSPERQCPEHGRNQFDHEDGHNLKMLLLLLLLLRLVGIDNDAINVVGCPVVAASFLYGTRLCSTNAALRLHITAVVFASMIK